MGPVPVALVTPEPAAWGCWPGCTSTAGEGLIHNTAGGWFHGFFIGEGRRTGTELLTLPNALQNSPWNPSLPRSTKLTSKIKFKKGGKNYPALTPLVSYWDDPPHTFSSIAATVPSWRTPWAEGVPLALVRRWDWLQLKPTESHHQQSDLNNHKVP